MTQKKQLAALVAAAALLPGATLAQTKPTAKKALDPAPPLAAPRPLLLPPIVQQTLPNGLKLVLLEDHRQPAVWMRLAVPAGTVRDPDAKVGLAAMTAALLDKGTATRSETQIADQTDKIGASLGAAADDDYLTISANGLSANADTLFDLLADVALYPTFPVAELDRARTRTLSAIAAALAQPATLADAALARRVYGAHPYGNFSSGTPQTLASLTPADLQAFHDTFFAPNAATLFLVGDLTPVSARTQAERVFGAWAKRDVPAPPAAPVPVAAAGGKTPRITVIDRPGAAQTEVRIGSLAEAYGTANRVPGSVATAVLGLGQFEGRLTVEIRVKRGLTYGASSHFSRSAQAGEFEISTFTKNKSTGEVVQIALNEAKRLAQTPPPAGELADRKTFLNGSFAVSVATPDGILARLVPAVLYGNGPDDLRKYAARVQAVTPAQIKAVMAAVTARPTEIVLVGDAKAIAADVAKLGKATVIEASALDLTSPTLQADKSAAPAPVVATPEQAAEGKARLLAAVKAHGGDAFLNVKQLVLKGSGQVSQGGLDIPVEAVTLTVAEPDRNRTEMKTSFGDIILGSPGGGKGRWISAMGNVQDAPPGGSGGGDPIGLLRQAMQSNLPLRALPDTDGGKSPLSPDGKTLQGFAVTDKQGRETSVYAEADTHLVRRISSQSPIGATDILLSDYHATEGVQLPGTLRVVQDGKDVVRFTFTGFEINKPIPASLFARPAP